MNMVVQTIKIKSMTSININVPVLTIGVHSEQYGNVKQLV